MGDPDTFTSFLRWGVKNYPAERSILVMWDHGGTAADGICYDENFGYDCLSREELKAAFEAASLPKKFDFILFDACYMSSLETAVLAQPYAHYMTASQKIVPGGGLDYRTLAEAFADTDSETLGRILCDSFVEKCRQAGREQEAQLSFFDLAGTDRVVQLLNLFSFNLLVRNTVVGNTFRLFNAALDAIVEHGKENVNVIDLAKFMEGISLSPELNYGKEILRAEKKLILYQVKDVNGLPTRNIRSLKPGDRVSTYMSFDEAGKVLAIQEEFVIGEDGGTLSMVPLEEGVYRYQFVVTDIVGNTFHSDYCFFEVKGERDARSFEIKEIAKTE